MHSGKLLGRALCINVTVLIMEIQSYRETDFENFSFEFDSYGQLYVIIPFK